jgi:hypothetical protein
MLAIADCVNRRTTYFDPQGNQQVFGTLRLS